MFAISAKPKQGTPKMPPTDIFRPSVQEAGDEYEANIRNAINMVYKSIPYTIVNMIPLFVRKFPEIYKN